MSRNTPVARVLAKTVVHDGFLKLNRYSLEIARHAGGLHRIERELMERGNAVGVLPYDPRRDTILLGNEFRPGAMVAGDPPFRDQLFAGAMEPEESPLDAASRELQEESGLELQHAAIIHPGLYVSSGGTSEKIALVFGLVDALGAAGTIHGSGADEDVLVMELPAAQFVDQVKRLAIDDCKTLIAGQWFAERWSDLRQSRLGYLPAGAPPRSLQR